jgi:hypothetical protein
MPVFSFVWLKNYDTTSLDLKAEPEILRVKEVKDSDVLVVLEGSCGSTIDLHITAGAPCHVPIKDAGIYPTMDCPELDLACEVCNKSSDAATMLLCDACGSSWHIHCLTPPLSRCLQVPGCAHLVL